MNIKIYFCLLLFYCFSCRNSGKETEQNVALTFNKTQWIKKELEDYPFRDRMLKDLIDHLELHGINQDSVISLLGQPDHIDNGHLFYRISQVRIGLFPLHTKTLVIKLNKNGLVEWRKIHGNNSIF